MPLISISLPSCIYGFLSTVSFLHGNYQEKISHFFRRAYIDCTRDGHYHVIPHYCRGGELLSVQCTHFYKTDLVHSILIIKGSC